MEEIAVGLVGETNLVVDESLCTSHLGPEVGPILATPRLANLFEHTCIKAVAPILAAGYGTVGSEILVKHVAPTPLGFNLHVRTEVVEVDGIKHKWRLEAYDDSGLVAEGIHWRATVNLAKLGSRIAQKKAQFGK